MIISPCTMCVQYRGGVQYRGEYHEYHGGYLEYRGVFSTVGDIMINVGDILSTMGCSVPWGYHEYRGVILSTTGNTQHRGGYHEYQGVFSTMGGIFCYLSTPRY